LNLASIIKSSKQASYFNLFIRIYGIIEDRYKVPTLSHTPNSDNNGDVDRKGPDTVSSFLLEQLNNMTFSSSIGIVAACLTSVAFVPQVWRVIATRDTRAISLWMYLLFSTGVGLWLLYGLLLSLWPVIIANSVTLLLSLIVIFFKLREHKESGQI